MTKNVVAPGLYFDPARKRYTFRPWVNGRRTERTLKASTDREARREYARVSQNVTATTSVRDLIAAYIGAGTPGAGVTPRGKKFNKEETARCKVLREFFGTMKAADVRVKHCLDYKAWRVRKIKRNVTGGRTVDMDLGTLSNVFRFGALSGLVESNPLSERPRFHTDTQHCRDHCCRSGDELHTVAGALGGLLALQFLFESTSGCRTGEVLPLRRDAKAGLPGHVREEGGQRYLCIARLKQGGDDPYDYIPVNAALSEVLRALDVWHAQREKPSCWYFPGRKKAADVALDEGALSHALRRVAAKLLTGRRLTSHGCRAFYVTWRRVQKADLYQIAAEVGHCSGVALILNTYGRRIPAWVAAEFSPFPNTVLAFWNSTTFTTTAIGIVKQPKALNSKITPRQRIVSDGDTHQKALHRTHSSIA